MTRKGNIGTYTSEGGEESDAGFKQDHGETTELVRTSDEEIRLKHTEESVEDGYTREKEEMSLTVRWKDTCQRYGTTPD